MTSHSSYSPVSALRERMIEDMTVRGIGEKTRHDYVRHVSTSRPSSAARRTSGCDPAPAGGSHRSTLRRGSEPAQVFAVN